MSNEQYANAANTSLNSSMDDSHTTVYPSSISGFPADNQFAIVVDGGTTTQEIMEVTDGAGTTTWTVTRASEPISGIQTAYPHALGATIQQVLTAQSLTNIIAQQSSVDILESDNTFTGINTFNNTLTVGSEQEFINNGSYAGTADIITSLTAGTGISVENPSGPGVATVTNGGVTEAVAGTGIDVSNSTGNVTFSNSGVTELVAGGGISLNASTGTVTITNTNPSASSYATPDALGTVVLAIASTTSTEPVVLVQNPSDGESQTLSGAFVVSDLFTADGGITVASGETITLTGSTVAGSPTWSDAQTFFDVTISSGETLTLTGAIVAGQPTWSSSQTFPGATISSSDALVLTGASVSGSPTWSDAQTFPGVIIVSGDTLTLTGATVAGQPTWSSSQTFPGVISNGQMRVEGNNQLAIDTNSSTANAFFGNFGNDTDATFGISVTGQELLSFNVSTYATIFYGLVTINAGATVPSGQSLTVNGQYAGTADNVTSLTAGTGISVSNPSGVGTATVTNSGVTEAVASTGITVSAATGNVTFTNSGVTSAVGGNGVSVSASTGAVTFTTKLSDSTLTIGSDGIALNLDSDNTWTAVQTFGNYISIGGATFNISSLATNNILRYNGTNWVNTTDVISFNGRTGVVSPESGDYSFSDITGTASNTQLSGPLLTEISGGATLTIGTAPSGIGSQTVNLNLGNANTWTAVQTFGNNINMGGATLDVLSLVTNNILRYNGTNWINTTDVISFNGRTGAVSPASSDYSFSEISGTVANTQLAGPVVSTITAGTGITVGSTPSGAATQSVSINLGSANTWTATQTFEDGIDITGTNSAHTAVIDLTSFGAGAPYMANNGSLHFPSATSGQGWGIYDKDATAVLDLWTDGTAVLKSANITLDNGSGSAVYPNGHGILSTAGADLSTDSAGHTFIVTPAVVGATGFYVKGLADQTAALQQWVNSSNGVLAAVDNAGNFGGVSFAALTGNTVVNTLSGESGELQYDGSTTFEWASSGNHLTDTTYVDPTNTATSETNYPSYNLNFSRSYWSGGEAVTGTSSLYVDSTGLFVFLNESGSGVWSVDQTGSVTTSGPVKSSSQAGTSGGDGTAARSFVSTGNLNGAITFTDSHGFIASNQSEGYSELDLVAAANASTSEDALRVYALTGSSPYSLSSVLFAIDRSGDVRFPGTLTLSGTYDGGGIVMNSTTGVGITLSRGYSGDNAQLVFQTSGTTDWSFGELGTPALRIYDNSASSYPVWFAPGAPTKSMFMSSTGAFTFSQTLTASAGIDITGTNSAHTAVIDLTSFGAGAPYMTTNGAFHFPSATSGQGWGIYDENAVAVLDLWTDGTKVVKTANNTLDNGSGAATFAGLITANGGVTVASGKALTLTGATITGSPTWSSGQTLPTLSLPSGTPSTTAGTLSQEDNVLYLGNGTTAVQVGGVTSISAGTAISVSGTGTVTVTNTGVTSLTAGNGISVSASTGGVTVSAVLNGSTLSLGSSGLSLNLAEANTWTGNQTVPALAASGLTGATASSRYVGATTSGAPGSGTFLKGDWVIDQTGTLWFCTLAGSPGTWTQIAGSGSGVSSLTAGDGVSVSASTGEVTVSAALNGSTLALGSSGLSLNLSEANTWSALQTFGNNISVGGATVDVTSLATNNVLRYNGTNWVNSTDVTSWNGRTGAVSPASDDYSFSQISGTASNSQLAGPLLTPVTGGTGTSVGPTIIGTTTPNEVSFTSGQSEYTPPTSIGSAALDTSGTGRRVTVLSNGWVVAVVTSGTTVGWYVSESGGSWTLLTSNTPYSSGTLYVALTSYGTTVYTLITCSSATGNICVVFDATDSPSGSNTYTVDSGQTSFGQGCAIEVTPGHNVIAVWNSKNTTYPNSTNIRMSTSVDGMTWATPTQLGVYNTSGVNCYQPSIGVSRSPTAENFGQYLIVFIWDDSGTYIVNSTGSALAGEIYSSSYAQSSPSVYCDVYGVWHCVWAGETSSSTTNTQIQYANAAVGSFFGTAKSITSLTAGTATANPQITEYDSYGGGTAPLIVFFQSTYSGETNIYSVSSSNSGSTWGTPTNFTSNTTGSASNPSVCVYQPNPFLYCENILMYENAQADTVSFGGTVVSYDPTTVLTVTPTQTGLYSLIGTIRSEIIDNAGPMNVNVWLTFTNNTGVVQTITVFDTGILEVAGGGTQLSDTGVVSLPETYVFATTGSDIVVQASAFNGIGNAYVAASLLAA